MTEMSSRKLYIGREYKHFKGKTYRSDEEDLFYSDTNMTHLAKVISEIDSGKASLAEHELIED